MTSVQSDAAAAMRGLHGSRVNGRLLFVEAARPSSSKLRETDSGWPPGSRLYVKKVGALNVHQLTEAFKPFGRFGEPVFKQKDYAFIQYTDADAASAAMRTLDGTDVGGYRVSIVVAQTRENMRRADAGRAERVDSDDRHRRRVVIDAVDDGRPQQRRRDDRRYDDDRQVRDAEREQWEYSSRDDGEVEVEPEPAPVAPPPVAAAPVAAAPVEPTGPVVCRIYYATSHEPKLKAYADFLSLKLSAVGVPCIVLESPLPASAIVAATILEPPAAAARQGIRYLLAVGLKEEADMAVVMSLTQPVNVPPANNAVMPTWDAIATIARDNAGWMAAQEAAAAAAPPPAAATVAFSVPVNNVYSMTTAGPVYAAGMPPGNSHATVTPSTADGSYSAAMPGGVASLPQYAYQQPQPQQMYAGQGVAYSAPPAAYTPAGVPAYNGASYASVPVAPAPVAVSPPVSTVASDSGRWMQPATAAPSSAAPAPPGVDPRRARLL